MRKALIVYYSLHGTTRRVAQAIGQGIAEGGYEVTLWDIIERGAAPDYAKYSLIGIGSPVYYYQLPIPVADYLQSLPRLENTAVFSFLLYGTYAFDTADLLRRQIRRSGTRFAGHFQCRGADIYQGYLKAGYLFSPHSPAENEIADARAFGLALTGCDSEKPDMAISSAAKPGPVYRFERLISRKWFMRTIYSRTFKAEKDRCQACGGCERACPVHNIKVEDSRPPVWGQNCTGCLNCQMKCPELAISSFADWPLTRLLIKHNVKAALNDPSIEYEELKPE